MTAAKKLTERTAAPFAGTRVNRTAGTIDGVLICGTASANGRDYPARVLRRDFAVYEGRPVNCDHGRESTVDRRFGWFSHVYPGPDGRPRGRLNCLKSHPMYARVMEAAERNPALFGFSHVALCDTRPGPGGREVVEAIRAVESIDLVAQPATTKGLFEGTAVPFTRARLIEWLARHPGSTAGQIAAAKRLVEIAGPDGPVAPDPAALPTDPPADPAGGTDPEAAGGALDGAFLTAATDELRACMAAAGDPARITRCLAKIKKMLRAHADITADDDDDDDGTDDDDTTDLDDSTDDPAATTPEGRRPRGRALLEALDACDRAGFRAGRADLELIAAAPRARRAALAERLKRTAEHDRPTSAGRGRIAPGGARTGRPPSDPKTFAEWLGG